MSCARTQQPAFLPACLYHPWEEALVLHREVKMIEANMGILHPGHWGALIQHGSLAPTLRCGFNCIGTHLGPRLVLKHSSGEAKVRSVRAETNCCPRGNLKEMSLWLCSHEIAAHWVSPPDSAAHIACRLTAWLLHHVDLLYFLWPLAYMVFARRGARKNITGAKNASEKTLRVCKGLYQLRNHLENLGGPGGVGGNYFFHS